MADGQTVEIIGSVDKLDTFSSKGGGFHIKISAPHDPRAMASLAANLEKIADITFAFRATAGDDDDESGDLFDGDE